MRTGDETPILDKLHSKDTVVRDFTTEIMAHKKKIELNYTLTEDQRRKFDHPADQEDVRQALLQQMCERLAVIGIDFLQNQSISRSVFASAQKSDDYLSVIYKSVRAGTDEFPNFFIKQGVLYKKLQDRVLKQSKFVICIPNELMPSVIHTLHQALGHPAASTTLRNFPHYYYHHKVRPMIRDYVQACLTCKYAHKQDLKKSVPSAERTLQPTRPQQHLYCALIPMPKGQYSYILFCLDAYSQYVYALPLKDKSAPSVLQGFLSLFATTGWYEALYLDNETSFQKAAKNLVKIAPIALHYSMPYCHFQDNAENYIKDFKKTFVKILNNTEHPHSNEDWPLLLPTVTQALNKKIILSLGLSRDSLHYNRQSEFFPLAHLADADSTELDSVFDSLALNVYDRIKKQRNK
jgi:Integrase zinc binding domain